MTGYIAGKSLKSRIPDTLMYIIVMLFALFCLLPFVLVLSASLSDETSIMKYGYKLVPKVFSTLAYRMILTGQSQIVDSYKVTIIVTVFGTAASVFLTTLFAYPLSRKRFRWRNAISFYLFFTMLFNGGLVPWFILCTHYLGLRDNYFALIVPYLIGAWNVFLMRNFFSTIPDSLEESARIDGAGDYRIFITIFLPLSKPGLATLALFTTLAYWNDWWLALILTSGFTLLPVQLYLMRIIANAEFIRSNMNVSMVQNITIPTEAARMATAILAIGPIIFAYPLFQKYIVKGLVIGAIKG